MKLQYAEESVCIYSVNKEKVALCSRQSLAMWVKDQVYCSVGGESELSTGYACACAFPRVVGQTRNKVRR
jgi:hypothetical protein